MFTITTEYKLRPQVEYFLGANSPQLNRLMNGVEEYKEAYDSWYRAKNATAINKAEARFTGNDEPILNVNLDDVKKTQTILDKARNNLAQTFLIEFRTPKVAHRKFIAFIVNRCPHIDVSDEELNHLLTVFKTVHRSLKNQ